MHFLSVACLIRIRNQPDQNCSQVSSRKRPGKRKSVSVGGGKIELFNKDNYQDYVSTIKEQWLIDIINAYDGNPYEYLVEIAQLAQQDGVIKGFFLHQGESNTNDTQWPSKVKKIYNDYS